jgi:hypothetical protein
VASPTPWVAPVTRQVLPFILGTIPSTGWYMKGWLAGALAAGTLIDQLLAVAQP